MEAGARRMEEETSTKAAQPPERISAAGGGPRTGQHPTRCAARNRPAHQTRARSRRGSEVFFRDEGVDSGRSRLVGRGREGCAPRRGSNINIIITEVTASHVSTAGLVLELSSGRAKRSLPQRRLHNVALPRPSDQARRRRRGGYGLYARRRSEDSALSTLTRTLRRRDAGGRGPLRDLFPVSSGHGRADGAVHRHIPRPGCLCALRNTSSPAIAPTCRSRATWGAVSQSHTHLTIHPIGIYLRAGDQPGGQAMGPSNRQDLTRVPGVKPSGLRRPSATGQRGCARYHLLASQGLAQQTYYYLLPLPTDRKIVRSTGKDSSLLGPGSRRAWGPTALRPGAASSLAVSPAVVLARTNCKLPWRSPGKRGHPCRQVPLSPLMVFQKHFGTDMEAFQSVCPPAHRAMSQPA
ncbi:hypothetical protein M432DRAFT_642340 [Thermoascus aurantiacus ATCC 26904]